MIISTVCCNHPSQHSQHSYVAMSSLQAHAALGSRLQQEQSTTAQLTGQVQDGNAVAANLQRTIADLEHQVIHVTMRSLLLCSA